MLASRVLLERPRALSPAWTGLEVTAPPQNDLTLVLHRPVELADFIVLYNASSSSRITSRKNRVHESASVI